MHKNRPASEFEGSMSDEELRAALTGVVRDGWAGDDGQRVLGALEDRSGRWAAALDRRNARRGDATEPADVLQAAWLMVHRFAPRIAASHDPWRYLWTGVRRALAVDNVAEACLSSRAMRLYAERGESPPTAVRLGVDDSDLLDDHLTRARMVSEWSPALCAFVDVIVDAGGRRRYWTEVVDRAVEVMADARNSYQEHALRRDPYLTLLLRLRPIELSALAALLIGPRRGDRAAESLLLALHADPTTTPERVPRASQRLEVLLARPDVRAVGFDGSAVA